MLRKRWCAFIWQNLKTETHCPAQISIDGDAMGSPLGLVLCKIFMCHFEEQRIMNGRVYLFLQFGIDMLETHSLIDIRYIANEFLMHKL